MSDLDGVVAHPGGAKVIAAMTSSLELEPGSLDVEAEVLRCHGNMSSVTSVSPATVIPAACSRSRSTASPMPKSAS